jgi:hypothetical protein
MWWIWVLIVVVVLALGSWLLAVRLAANKPGNTHPHPGRRLGQVQGGSHVGGGRSVMPRRDAEVIPDADPETPAVPVQEERRGSPMDL